MLSTGLHLTSESTPRPSDLSLVLPVQSLLRFRSHDYRSSIAAPRFQRHEGRIGPAETLAHAEPSDPRRRDRLGIARFSGGKFSR